MASYAAVASKSPFPWTGRNNKARYSMESLGTIRDRHKEGVTLKPQQSE